jgi:hypothetical protein
MSEHHKFHSMRTILAAVFFAGLIALSACQKRKDDSRSVTQRIQYDVSIKSPDLNFDWWVQNIEGMNREAFISDLLQAAYTGDVTAYDPFLLSKLEPGQISRIGRRSDTLRMQMAVPPYNFYDTIISVELSIHDITRIRFLEEWNLSEKNMQIHKEVLGMAPLLESYDESGNLRGYQPMFWVFFNKDYPQALRGKVLNSSL